MKRLYLIAALAAAGALAGCESDDATASADGNYEFGSAVKANVAAQSVPANPATLNTPPVTEGARASLAQRRYDADKVKPPVDPQTEGSSSSAGSSGGGSSGGGGGTSSGGSTGP
jgi:uncharacterized membrane protein YgcG